MKIVDSHVHTINSPDGRDKIADIVVRAKELGLSYLATTDHLDYDLLYGHNKCPIKWDHINLEKYKAEWDEAKSLAGDNLEFCFGIEVGFERDELVFQKLKDEVFSRYDFDVVINSVHFVNGMDVIFPNAFFFKTKKRMYGDYLKKVLDSLDAPYHYDIVAHLGYITRNAPYFNRQLTYRQFPELFDKILTKVIAKGKVLEVNTHVGLKPTEEILRRYFELGGRKLSFGSDSHRDEIAKDFDSTMALLKSIGFTHLSVFKNQKEQLVEIE